MNPAFWGPHAWIFLHSITMNYPKNPTEKDKQIYFDFFNQLKDILPCQKCAHHYGEHIKKHPINTALESRDSMIRWLIQIHNEVNEDLGKPQLSYEEVIQEYQNKFANLGTDPTIIYKVAIIILIAIIIFMIYKKKNIF